MESSNCNPDTRLPQHRDCLCNWLITGATGFIGRELVHYLLTSTQDQLTLLVRGTPAAGDAEQRIHDQQHNIDPSVVIDQSRVTVIECDITREKLGLAQTDMANLQRFDNHFIHLAANTRFSETLDVARSVNVKGTESAIDVALDLHRHGSLVRFAYVSTAYVHGSSSGVVRVDDPLKPLSARNTYERSKIEAELKVKSRAHDLPSVIFRPSIVVGDSASGRSSGSSTMYWAIKQYLRGRRRFFANEEARLDIVPVDFVVSAMVRLMSQPVLKSRCFPLVAGVSSDITLAQLSQSVTRFFGLPAPVLMSPRIIDKCGGMISKASALFGQKVFVDNMLSYLPYFAGNPRFDNNTTLAALASIADNRQPSPPEFEDYCDALFRHCLKMGWKRSPRQRKSSRGFRFGKAAG